MTSKLKDFDTTAGNNNSAAPNGWPEGMLPSDVNNAAREMMARLAEWYQDASWINFDDASVCTATTGTTLTLTGDLTARYLAGRCIRLDASNSKLGVIRSSSYSAPSTTVTMDGYTITGTPTTIELGPDARSLYPFGEWRIQTAKAGAYTAVASDRSSVIPFGATATLSLTAAATLGNGFAFLVSVATGYTVTIDPNGAETVNGLTTAKVAGGGVVMLVCDGSNWKMYWLANATDRVSVTDGASVDLRKDVTGSSYARLDTSTTTITAIVLNNGEACDVLVNTSRNITAGASLLITGRASAENLAVAAGDTFRVIGEASSVARIVSGTKSDGGPIGRTLTRSASTSGTSVDFTGIPASAKRITVNFESVSTSSTSPPQIQLGTSGGYQTTNYNGVVIDVAHNVSPGASAISSGFDLVNTHTAASVLHGSVTLTLSDSSNGVWCAQGSVSRSDATRYSGISGSKSLSGTLDRLRIRPTNGTDTFDAGAISVLVE